MGQDNKVDKPDPGVGGAALLRFSDWMDENWMIVKRINIAVVVASSVFLARYYISKQQVKNISQLSHDLFEKRVTLPVKVSGFRREKDKVVADVIHTPRWLPRLFVSSSSQLPVRLLGTRSKGIDAPLFQDTPEGEAAIRLVDTSLKTQVQLLFKESCGSGENCEVIVGHLLFRDASKSVFSRDKDANFALHLIQNKLVEPFPSEDPGRWASSSLEAIRAMDEFLTQVEKAAIQRDQQGTSQSATTSRLRLLASRLSPFSSSTTKRG